MEGAATNIGSSQLLQLGSVVSSLRMLAQRRRRRIDVEKQFRIERLARQSFPNRSPSGPKSSPIRWLAGVWSDSELHRLLSTAMRNEAESDRCARSVKPSGTTASPRSGEGGRVSKDDLVYTDETLSPGLWRDSVGSGEPGVFAPTLGSRHNCVATTKTRTRLADSAPTGG